VKQVAWTPVARSSFQRRTRGIPGSNPTGNNSWPVRMPLRMSQISRPHLKGRKPVRKPKQKKGRNMCILFRFNEKCALIIPHINKLSLKKNRSNHMSVFDIKDRDGGHQLYIF